LVGKAKRYPCQYPPAALIPPLLRAISANRKLLKKLLQTDENGIEDPSNIVTPETHLQVRHHPIDSHEEATEGLRTPPYTPKSIHAVEGPIAPGRMRLAAIY